MNKKIFLGIAILAIIGFLGYSAYQIFFKNEKDVLEYMRTHGIPILDNDLVQIKNP